MPRLAALVAAAVLAASCGGTGGPEPGSDAARYCDVARSEEAARRRDPTGENTAEFGGVYYDADCLDAYSWDAEG